MAPNNLRPCPFCGATGQVGPDAYYFQHTATCWLRVQQGTMLDCVSTEELELWNARNTTEFICDRALNQAEMEAFDESANIVFCVSSGMQWLGCDYCWNILVVS
jgi:hypothetical protein